MNALAIEALAASVAKTYNLKLPIDLEKVCSEEAIALAPGNYSRKFHGRIEFHPKEGVFILFHPAPRPGLSIGRIRFSICHELGHYFIEEHRELIVSGRVHNSLEPFKPAKDRIETEADQFASALLVPEVSLRDYMGSRTELPLEAILQLADLARASIQATAFRYVAMTDEACVAIISKGREILLARASRRAEETGFTWLGSRCVPEESTAWRCLKSGPYVVVDGPTHTGVWFSYRRYGAKLWEESARLGATEYALTMLSWPDLKAN